MYEKHTINSIIDPHLTSSEIRNRKKLVDWMCDMGEKLKFSSETIHKAVSYVDRIICRNTLLESEYKNVALICILLAGKLNEHDPKIEKIRFIFCSMVKMSRLNVMNYEAQIARSLNWEFHCVTVMDFLKFFIPQGIAYTSDNINCAPLNEQAIKGLRQYCEFFADMCLQEYEFIAIDSLIMAAGIIAAARRIMSFSKIWPEELETLVHIKAAEAEVFSEKVLIKYSSLFPKSDANKFVKSVANSSFKKDCAANPHSIIRYI